VVVDDRFVLLFWFEAVAVASVNAQGRSLPMVMI
jgi:hypothetical protein